MNLFVLADAKAEIKETVSFYETRSRSLGADFLDAVDLGLQEVSDSPESWPKIYAEYRKYNLQRFPFSVIYRLDQERLVIVAIAHHARRPGYWRSRTEH